jgi:hypothetical protein
MVGLIAVVLVHSAAAQNEKDNLRFDSDRGAVTAIKWRISNGNSKTLVDRDSNSWRLCKAGSSSLELHSDDGHRAICGKSSPKS